MAPDEIARLLDLVKVELEEPDARAEDFSRKRSRRHSTTRTDIRFVSKTSST
jgi:hypothetical protein